MTALPHPYALVDAEILPAKVKLITGLPNLELQVLEESARGRVVLYNHVHKLLLHIVCDA